MGFPFNLFAGDHHFAAVAEKSLGAFGAKLELFAAHRAAGFHVKFIVMPVLSVALTGKSGALRG